MAFPNAVIKLIDVVFKSKEHFEYSKLKIFIQLFLQTNPFYNKNYTIDIEKTKYSKTLTLTLSLPTPWLLCMAWEGGDSAPPLLSQPLKRLGG